jgi:hypothetical protein
MTYPKHPSPALPDKQPADKQPLIQSAFDSVERIRHANSPAGVLSTRSEDALRRYVLVATDEADRTKRQMSLLREASIVLAKLPTNETSSTPGAVRPRLAEMALVAWPVVVCMDRPIRVSNRIDLTGRVQEQLAQAFADAFVDAHEPGLCCARVDGFVNVQLMCGLSPLAINSALRAETRRLLNPAQHVGHLGTPAHKLGQSGEQSMHCAVGPNQPIAFLLVAYLAWDFARNQPRLKPSLSTAKGRLHSLCNAFFTHQLLGPAGTKTKGSELARPTVRLGEPQLLYDASTQAQWMQLAWLAERARQGGFNHGLNMETMGSYRTLTADLTDDDDEVVAVIQYSYDGFWQTDEQLALIDQKVSLAQGTGLMDCSSWEFNKKH